MRRGPMSRQKGMRFCQQDRVLIIVGRVPLERFGIVWEQTAVIVLYGCPNGSFTAARLSSLQRTAQLAIFAADAQRLPRIKVRFNVLDADYRSAQF
jgi:hypothetical protein